MLEVLVILLILLFGHPEDDDNGDIAGPGAGGPEDNVNGDIGLPPHGRLVGTS